MFYKNKSTFFLKWYLKEVKKLPRTVKIAKWFFYAPIFVAFLEPVIYSNIPQIIKKPPYGTFESYQYLYKAYGGFVNDDSYILWEHAPSFLVLNNPDKVIFTSQDTKVNISIYTILLIVCIVVLVSQIASHKEKIKTYPAFDKNKSPSLIEMIYNIGSDFGVKRPKIKVLYSKSMYPSASILSNSQNVYLLINFGLLMLYLKDNNQAKAVIAHEFAHVIHHDSDSWYLMSVWSTVLWNIMLPVYSILGIMFFLYGLSISTPMLPYPLIFTLLARSSVVKARKKSELMADVASAIYVDYESIHGVIKDYLKPTNYPKNKKDRRRKWYKLYLSKTRYIVTGSVRIEELKKAKNDIEKLAKENC